MRITGRQLRRIIQEEVARMMNEEPLPGNRVISPVTDQNYVDAFSAIEGALNDSIDLNLGATVSSITDALRGRNQNAVAVLRKHFSSAGPMKGYIENKSYAEPCVYAILALNNAKAEMQMGPTGIYGRPAGGGAFAGAYVQFDVESDALEKTVMGSRGREEFLQAAEAGGAFLFKKFGA